MPKKSKKQSTCSSEGEKWDEKKDSIRFYDTTAASYEELYGKEQENKYKIALKTVEAATLGTVLDVGCGAATFLQKIIGVSSLRVGVDLSLNMLSNETEMDVPSTHLLCADADYLPIRDGIFDSVFTFTLLQNMPNPRSTFLEMFRVLRRNGIIIATWPIGSNLIIEVSQWFKDSGKSFREVEDQTFLKDHVLICWEGERPSCLKRAETILMQAVSH